MGQFAHIGQQYGMKNKAANIFTFDVHWKVIADLFFIPLMEDKHT